MILEAVYNLLSSDAGIIDVIGDQLHYEHRPQPTTDQTGAAIVLQRGSLTTPQNHGGASDSHSGFVRINILAPEYLTCEDIAAQVRNILNGHSGSVTLASGDTIRIAFIALDDESDIPAEVPEGASRPTSYGIRADYRFAYRINQ